MDISGFIAYLSACKSLEELEMENFDRTNFPDLVKGNYCLLSLRRLELRRGITNSEALVIFLAQCELLRLELHWAGFEENRAGRTFHKLCSAITRITQVHAVISFLERATFKRPCRTFHGVGCTCS